MDLRDGKILNIDKPYGWSSTDVVRKLQNTLKGVGYPKRIKIGHAGTLDPLATGVLLVCIGKATKQVPTLQDEQKEYEFTVTLGATTTSYDLEHPVNEIFPWEHITQEDIEKYLKSIVGPLEQVPPLYSAKKIGGKRAYEYARDGKEVEMRVARVEIYSAELLSYDAPNAVLRVACSKGTYVRSIARDMGVELGSGGYLSALRRTKSGGYDVDKSISVEAAIEFIKAHPCVGEGVN